VLTARVVMATCTPPVQVTRRMKAQPGPEEALRTKIEQLSMDVQQGGCGMPRLASCRSMCSGAGALYRRRGGHREMEHGC